MRTSLFRIFVICCVPTMLAACTAPQASSPSAAAGQAATAALTTKPPPPKGGPLPPERVRGGAPVNRSCKTNADCVVKDVGSCCGTLPACVNIDSPTAPKGVQAECK